MARDRRPPTPGARRPAWRIAGTVARAQLFVLLRDVLVAALSVWVFEYRVGYRFPKSENLILYFVAIPIIWSTLIHIWTATSYREQRTAIMAVFTHTIAVLILVATSFLISATLTTISETLDQAGVILFHFVGWTVLFGLIYYDVVDVGR